MFVVFVFQKLVLRSVKFTHTDKLFQTGIVSLTHIAYTREGYTSHFVSLFVCLFVC